MPFELTCGWLPEDRCGQPAVGMAAHPTEGVIPVCVNHVDTYEIPLISRIESE